MDTVPILVTTNNCEWSLDSSRLQKDLFSLDWLLRSTHYLFYFLLWYCGFQRKKLLFCKLLWVSANSRGWLEHKYTEQGWARDIEKYWRKHTPTTQQTQILYKIYLYMYNCFELSLLLKYVVDFKLFFNYTVTHTLCNSCSKITSTRHNKMNILRYYLILFLLRLMVVKSCKFLKVTPNELYLSTIRCHSITVPLLRCRLHWTVGRWIESTDFAAEIKWLRTEAAVGREQRQSK